MVPIRRVQQPWHLDFEAIYFQIRSQAGPHDPNTSCREGAVAVWGQYLQSLVFPMAGFDFASDTANITINTKYDHGLWE